MNVSIAQKKPCKICFNLAFNLYEIIPCRLRLHVPTLTIYTLNRNWLLGNCTYLTLVDISISLQINCADPSSRNDGKNETDANILKTKNSSVKTKKSTNVNDEIIMSTSSENLHTVFRQNSESGESSSSSSSGFGSSRRQSSPDPNNSAQSLNTFLQGISLQNDKFNTSLFPKF